MRSLVQAAYKIDDPYLYEPVEKSSIMVSNVRVLVAATTDCFLVCQRRPLLVCTLTVFELPFRIV